MIGPNHKNDHESWLKTQTRSCYIVQVRGILQTKISIVQKNCGKEEIKLSRCKENPETNLTLERPGESGSPSESGDWAKSDIDSGLETFDGDSTLDLRLKNL